MLHEACACTLIEMLKNCLPNSNLDVFLNLFYNPLSEIISGGSDKVAQVASSHCILRLVQHVLSCEGKKEYIESLFPKFLALFIVLSVSREAHSNAMSHFVDFCSIKHIVSNLYEIFRKLKRILVAQNPSSHAVFSLSV